MTGGLFPQSWYEHRVSYGETDAMGVVYYAEYLHLFERARGQFIRECGLSYREVEARGIFLPVREAACRYRAPARYDDILYIHTSIAALRHASIQFAYTIYAENKTTVLTTGSTLHAFVSSTGKPVAVPDWFKELVTLPA